MTELEAIPGTGKDERVTKRDILAYIDGRGSAPTAATPSVEAPKTTEGRSQDSKPGCETQLAQGDEIIEMDRMRKLIADHMVMSKHTSPHVTSFC